MKEFKKARIGLTLWYILISIGMLVIFSLAAISAERHAFSKIDQALSNRTQRPALSALLETRIAQFDANFIKELLLFDIILLIVAAGLSYYLSGLTLKPIQEMVKRQEEFASDASHELRTPLTTIGIEIEAFRRTENSISQKGIALFESVTDEINRMSKTIEGLLVLVRGEQNVKKLTPVSILKIVSETKARFKKQLSEKKIAWKDSIPKNLKVSVSAEDLGQLLSILIDNAIKYTPRGGRIATGGLREKDWVIIEFKDSGVGIAEKDLPHVFERFYRGESGVSGTGLGLSIAKKIVENYHGTISVKSISGKGSTFVLQLPSAS